MKAILAKTLLFVVSFVVLFFGRIIDILFFLFYMIWGMIALILWGRGATGKIIARYGKRIYESTLTKKQKQEGKKMVVVKKKKKYGW